MRGSFLTERRADKSGSQLAVARQAARKIGNANAQRTYRVGQVGRTFLYNVQRIHACLELTQRLRGQGIRDAKLEHRCIREMPHPHAGRQHRHTLCQQQRPCARRG